MTTDMDEATLLNDAPKIILDGTIYQKWFMPIPVPEMFEKMKDFEVLDDDVLTTGYPRSGNHWAYEVIRMILRQTTEFAPRGFMEEILDARLTSRGGLDDFTSPRQLVMHNRPKRFPRQVVEKKIKVVFLLRNPKDALVSMYTLWTRFKVHELRFKGSWDQFIDVYLNGNMTYGTWFDHTLEVEKFIEDNPDVPTYIHVYEDMKENPVESIRKLCAFLGKPDTLAEDIAKATDFSHMKTSATTLARNEDFMFLGKDDPTVMRKGVIGDWKNTFTVAQNERFNTMFREKMAGSKCARLVEKYL